MSKSARTRFFTLPAGTLMLALALSLVAGCSSSPAPPAEATGSYGPGFPEGSAGWSAQERGVYRAAFDAGQRDKKEGYRYDDDRVTLPLDQTLRAVSRQGYRGGYYYDQSLRRAARANAAAAGDGGTAPAAAEGSSGHAPPVPAPVRPASADPFAVPFETRGAGEEAR